MRHLDEGTVHAWLDGALPAAEAAGVEAHVAECAECGAKVAEARGFIAGSSRILIALDDAPRNVAPARPAWSAAPRFSRPFLRAAAAVLVVATGGLLVLQLPGDEPVAVKAAADSVTRQKVAAQPPAVATTGSASAVTTTHSDVKPARPRPGTILPPPSVTQETKVAVSRDTTIDVVLTRDAAPLETRVATGLATTQPQLRVVREERITGGMRTTYEVGSGTTVTLSEFEPALLQVTGTSARATTIARGGASAMSAQTESRAMVVPDAPLSSSSSTTPTAAHSADKSAGTIRWTDRSTGKLMILSGRFSEGELERIRVRIEQERARTR